MSRRVAEALARDIGGGVLAAGARLPPQRELAHRLGVSVGAVTKAYAEVERSGLITAHVGRGSFVAEAAPAASDEPVDMARNLPPFGPARARLAEAVTRLPRTPGFLDAVAYAPALGTPAQRQSMAGWIAASSGLEVAAERVMLTAGAQQAMALAFAAICRPGDTVLCEAATYFGMKTLAEHAGYRLQGLAMDAEGVLPEALDAAAPGARAVFLTPTLQNPTGRIMGAARRREIAEVARKHRLGIVEDDVYGGYAKGFEPLAALAPERTFFLTSLSKTVAPGLRAGALVAPAGGGHEPALLRGLQALSVAGGSLGWMIATQWIESGVAAEIAAAVTDESQGRLALALDVLGAAAERPASPASPHLWLPMPELEAERVAGRALRAGVRVTPPTACLAAPELESGLRLCLGAAPDRTTLERGLRAVAEALSPRMESSGQPMV